MASVAPSAGTNRSKRCARCERSERDEAVATSKGAMRATCCTSASRIANDAPSDEAHRSDAQRHRKATRALVPSAHRLSRLRRSAAWRRAWCMPETRRPVRSGRSADGAGAQRRVRSSWPMRWAAPWARRPPPAHALVRSSATAPSGLLLPPAVPIGARSLGAAAAQRKCRYREHEHTISGLATPTSTRCGADGVQYGGLERGTVAQSQRGCRDVGVAPPVPPRSDDGPRGEEDEHTR